MNTPHDFPWHKKMLDCIAAHQDEAGALLPILHEMQDALGYIPEPSLPLLARALNQSRAEIYGVVSFYPYFRLTPPARHTVHICRAEACQARGANALIEHAKAQGYPLHSTSQDGQIGVEAVYCLGQCAIGPALLINDSELHARVDNAAFDRLIHDLRQAPESAQ